MALRVLLVQHDHIAARKLEGLLIARGDDVWLAWDLGQAASLLRQVKPDLVVFDLHYPGDDWTVFLRFVRAVFPNTRTILTNQHPDLEREIHARQLGVDVILRQPFEAYWLSQALEAVEKGIVPAFQPSLSRQERIPAQIKVDLPFLFLVLVIVMVCAEVVSHVYLQTYQQRFNDYVANSLARGGGWFAVQQQRLLTQADRIGASPEMGEAVASRDMEKIRKTVLLAALDTEAEAAAVFEPAGRAVLAMSVPEGAAAGQYRYGNEENQALLETVEGLLPDPAGPQAAAAGGPVWALRGGYLFISTPIAGGDGQPAGWVILGKWLPPFVEGLRQAAGAEVTVYTLDGQPVVSTLFSNAESYPLGNNQPGLILQADPLQNRSRILALKDADFTEILVPWLSSSGQPVGVIGQAFSHTLLEKTGRYTQPQVFAMAAGLILFLITAVSYLTRVITNPLKPLLGAASQVGMGNLDVRVDAGGDDDVAAMSHSFNWMVAGLQEGILYRDLLGRPVSPEVRQQMRGTLQSGEFQLEGQEAVVTVLVSEIQNFSALSQGISPVRVVEWLDRYYDRIITAITDQGGIVNQLDGHTIQASFGALPACLPPQESARAACLASLEIMRLVNELNEQRSKMKEPAFHTTVGIHTGPAVLGGVETAGRLHLTLLGSAVAAARQLVVTVRGLFGGSEAILTRSVVDALDDQVVCFRLEQVERQPAGGRADADAVFRLLSVNDLLDNPFLQKQLGRPG